MPAYSSIFTVSRKLAFTCILVGFTLYPAGVQSQSTQDINTSNKQRLVFVPPTSQHQDIGDDLGRPPNRTSGGSRGPCTEQLVALVPGQGTIDASPGACTSESVSFLALTSVESPTFWFYVPQASAPELTAEFALLEGEKLVHKQTISLSKTPGIVSFKPNYQLKSDKVYRWIFSIMVNSQRPSQNPAVEGLIQLMPPNITLNNQLQQSKSKREAIFFYAENGVWHDALTALGQLRRQKPADSNLQKDWSDLLNSVGLSAMANPQIVDCCTPVSAARPASH